MKHWLSNHARVLLVGLCLLGVALVAPLGARAMQQPQGDDHHTPLVNPSPTRGGRQGGPAVPPQRPQVVRTGDFGSWKYTAVREATGELSASVQYDNLSVAGLRTHAATNQALIRQIVQTGGRADVQVTFRSPVTADDFRSWAAATGLRVNGVSLRTVDQRGQRSTLFINPQDGDPLPQAFIDGQLAEASRKVGPLTVQGVIMMHGQLEATRLPAIATDTRVFLADVTPTIVRRELAAAGIAGTEQMSINLPVTFWQLENLGLEQFR